MLPHGIYLWETGYNDMVSSATIEDVANAHSHFKQGMIDFSKGLEYEVSGCGVFRQLSDQGIGRIFLVNDCTTTMEVARFLVESDVLSDWDAVVAVRQAQGRGQLRRHWVSPAGNLHMSIVMPSAPKEGRWSIALGDLLPLVAGYVCCDVLREFGAGVEIKWPNDLLQENRKVGGMLIEERAGRVILGVGLNCVDSPPDSQMREDRSVEAGVLQTNGAVATPLSLAESLVNRGKSVYETLLDEFTPDQFSTMIVLRLAWLGRTVLVRESGTDAYSAIIVGISPKGGLVIRRDGKEHVLFSGSIFPL